MDPQIKEGETISFRGNTYEFEEKLGEGGFGQVYKAKKYTNQDYYVKKCFEKSRLRKLMSSCFQFVAVKIVDKSQLIDPQDAYSEVNMMKTLDHPNIIELYDAMESLGKNGENLIYLVMQWAWDGDLHHYINYYTVDEEEEKSLFRQIIIGVEYLHSKKIAHRDLKPQNILIKDGCVKIADFGLSKKFKHDDEMLSMCGTPRYAAPEVFDRNIPSYNGCKADIYSLGIILKDFVTNYGKKQMSSDCEALFKKLTSKDPSSRPTLTEILNDKWLEEI